MMALERRHPEDVVIHVPPGQTADVLPRYVGQLCLLSIGPLAIAKYVVSSVDITHDGAVTVRLVYNEPSIGTRVKDVMRMEEG